MEEKFSNTPVPGVLLRPIRAEDDAQMAGIVRTNLAAHQLALPGTAYYDPELAHLSAFYDARPEQRAYFVLEGKNGQVLGGAGLAECSAAESCAEVQKLYLADAAKGLGLGALLMGAVEERARALGYRALYLETHTNLTAALHLYEKLGYRPLKHALTAQHTTMDRFYRKDL